ncbi:hypothetical protein LZ31DRAFT_86098 [Colletotrichum somersetense]|nr:hypothetical protein LZ31DRAFT_86098 [Colletotrichum somersetense]
MLYRTGGKRKTAKAGPDPDVQGKARPGQYIIFVVPSFKVRRRYPGASVIARDVLSLLPFSTKNGRSIHPSIHKLLRLLRSTHKHTRTDGASSLVQQTDRLTDRQKDRLLTHSLTHCASGRSVLVDSCHSLLRHCVFFLFFSLTSRKPTLPEANQQPTYHLSLALCQPALFCHNIPKKNRKGTRRPRPLSKPPPVYSASLEPTIANPPSWPGHRPHLPLGIRQLNRASLTLFLPHNPA